MTATNELYILRFPWHLGLLLLASRSKRPGVEATRCSYLVAPCTRLSVYLWWCTWQCLHGEAPARHWQTAAMT